MSTARKKDFLIVFMLCAMCLMTVAYASLGRELEIKGTASISGNWDVKITNITPTMTQGAGATASVDANGTVGTIGADLKMPGDSVTYTVTVENNGSIDAKLDSIVDTLTPEYGTAGNPYITYDYSGISANDILEANEAVNFTITVKYVETAVAPKATTASLVFNLNYVQYYK